MEVINAIGRRKTSVARIYVKPGSGAISINKRQFEDYFPSDILRLIVQQPLDVVSSEGQFDISINVTGGGLKGQAEAIRLAISRALSAMDTEDSAPLKKEGFLRRDPRMVERKKYCRRKARRRFQFSKR